MPILHIIIPTIDSRSWLLEALESIYVSHPTEIADGTILVTVIDDCSEFSFFSQADASQFLNLELIHNQSRLGLAGVFNQSISICRGDLLQIMGHDDKVLPGFYRQLVSNWRKHGECAIYALGVEVIDLNSNIFSPFVDRIKQYLTPRGSRYSPQIIGGQRALVKLLIGNFLYFPGLVFNFDKISNFRFSQKAGVALDLDFICRLLINENFLSIFNGCFFFQYRRSALSYSGILGSTKKRYLEEKAVVVEIAKLAWNKGWFTACLVGHVALAIRAAEIFRLFKKCTYIFHFVRIKHVPK
jgi:glycosyltransferase involved in cell wall biosynthesis